MSSQALCRAAARATLGKDPWARDSHPKATFYANLDAHSRGPPGATLTPNSGSTPDSAAPTDIARSEPFTSFSTTSFTKVVKRRHRLEQGTPYKTTTIPSPLDPEDDSNREPWDLVTYSDGSCAWLDCTDGRTTVVVLNLRNGNRTKLTTDNREKLESLAFSRPLIAAVSIRGYCHVWNLETSQSSSFRLPNLGYSRILISGTKVVINYGWDDSFVYWSFNTGIARKMDIEGSFILAIAPHPSEERITIARLCRNDSTCDRGTLRLEECQLQIAEYSLDSMTEISSRYQSFPKSVFTRQAICLDDFVDNWGIYNVSQGSMTLTHLNEEPDGREWDQFPFSISIEPDGLVAFHTFSRVRDAFEFTRLEQGIVYSPVNRLLVLKPTITLGPSKSYVWYDYYITRTLPVSDRPVSVLGDAHFVILFDEEKMDIWTMDEPDHEDEDVVNLIDES